MKNTRKGKSRRAKTSSQAGKQKILGLLVVLGNIFLYVVLFYLLHRSWGSMIFIFSILPVITAAWYFGVRGAIAGSLLVFLLDIYLIYSVEALALKISLPEYITSGGLVLMARGVVIGLSRKISRIALEELRERKQVETALKEAVEAERSHRQMAEALREIAALLNSALKVEDVLDQIMTNVQKIASYDSIHIMLIEQGRVHVARHQGYVERGLQEFIENFDQRVEDVPGLRWMVEHQRPLVIRDTKESNYWLDFTQTSWIRSFAGLPISYRGNITGFLNLNSAIAGFYRLEYIEKLQPFADQAALAIENARVFENMQQSARRLAALNQASAVLNSPVNFHSTLQAALDCFKDALGLDRVYIALFTSQWRLIIRAGYSSTAEPILEGDEILLYENRPVDYVVENKTRLLAQSGVSDPLVAAMLPKLQEEGIYAQLLLPLVVGNEIIGVVSCQICTAGRSFRTEEVDLGGAIANLAAVRIEQARIFDEERKQVSSLTLLHAASLDISLSHNQPEWLKTIAERATWLGNAQGGSLYLCNPQKRELVCKSSYNFPYNLEGTLIRYGEGAAGRVAATGQPLIVDDYSSWLFAYEALPEDTAHIALLTAPVIFQGDVTGVIQILRTNPQESFTNEDTELLGLFASQVAIALENTRLYDEIQQIAIRDPLTGLYNRRGLYEVAEREIERAKRYNRPFSLFMVDIDHFKSVNDTYGHPVGDEVLVKLARRLDQNVRTIDVVGRYGGEEFIVLAIENNLEATRKLAERLGHIIAARPVTTSAGSIPVSVSIGVVELGEKAPGLQAMIQAADQALYLAKHFGRNQVQCFKGALEGD
jgi:diguanylate cyclase (GGDEF)-like protein